MSLTRDSLTFVELAVYDLGYRDAFVEFNAAMTEFCENIKHDRPLARRVMQERLTTMMQLHAEVQP